MATQLQDDATAAAAAAAELSEAELVAEMMKLPDFECYPIPKSWYKKYNIPLPVPETVQQSREGNYAFKTKKYALPPIIINEPQRDKDGKIILTELRPPEVIDIEVKQKPFDPDDTMLEGLDRSSIPVLPPLRKSEGTDQLLEQ